MESTGSHEEPVHRKSPADALKDHGTGQGRGKRKRRTARSQVFRVTGLPLLDPNEVKKELRAAIEDNMADEEGQVTIDTVPSCDGKGLNALVEFDCGVPEFLYDIKENPLDSVELEMGDVDISFDAHFHGFTQLYTARVPISMDIIAITGLAGHAYGSWRGRGTLGRMWLRDFLSKDLPNCRTMTYGYNSRLSTHGVGTILDYSKGFLEELKHIRKSDEARKRPIVFIAHSFGGIILAHSLVKAIMTDNRDHPTIAALHRSTYGIVFFGTPHKGLVISDLQRMLGAGHARHQLIDQISEDSDVLQSQLVQFKNIARDYRIVSFYEVEQTRELEQDPDTGEWKRTGPYVTKVDADSALLGFPEPMEVQIPAAGDHSNMVKFNTRQEKDYNSTIEKLREFEASASPIIAERHLDAAATKKCPISTVPFARDEHFVPRHDDEGKEILEIINSWFSSAKTHIRASIVGLGGTGKSQIAIEYAYRFHEQHSSRWVFWVSCRNSAAFEQSYASAVQQLKIPGFNDAKANPLELLLAWLKDVSNGHWLMILDNADTLEMFRPKQMPHNTASPAFSYGRYVPQVGHGAVLITTRNRTIVAELTNGDYVIHLGPMNEAEAVELFCVRQSDRPAAATVHHLVSQLDYIPLAISQAAAYIAAKQPRMTAERYSLLYQQEDAQSKLLGHENGDIRRDPGIPNAVINTWQLTFYQIKESTPKASELLSLMSTLDRQGIPGTLLEAWLPNTVEFEAAIGTLVEFSLVLTQSDGEVFGMHRLVQLATQHWLKASSKLKTWQGEATQLLSEAFPDGLFQNLARCESLLPHVTVVLQYRMEGKDLLLAQSSIMLNLAEFYLTKGHYSMSEQQASTSLALRQKLLEDDDDKVLSSKHKLAQAKLYQGLYTDSVSLNLQVLDVKKRILGPEHPDTLTSMNNLALTYTLQGQYDKAAELGEELLKLLTKVLGPEHPDTLFSMGNLASTYQIQGLHDKAAELEVEVLKLRTKVLGPEHPHTLASMGNLASAYSDQGQYDQAAELGAEVLKLRTKVLGPEHPDTLTTMNNLACTWCLQGRVAEALQLLENCASMRAKVLGPTHPDTKESFQALEGWRNER